MRPVERARVAPVLGVVAGLRNGTLAGPAPTVGLRDDGQGLFYRGRVNGLFGESGDGKTWVALSCTVQEVRTGRHVVMLDFEDNAPGIVQRLLDLGATEEEITERFHCVWPSDTYGFDAAERLAELVASTSPSLAILDSTGEAMSLDGVNPRADRRVAGSHPGCMQQRPARNSRNRKVHRHRRKGKTFARR